MLVLSVGHAGSGMAAFPLSALLRRDSQNIRLREKVRKEDHAYRAWGSPRSLLQTASDSTRPGLQAAERNECLAP